MSSFASRHLGTTGSELAALLQPTGQASLDTLIDAAVPGAIRLPRPLNLPAPLDEAAALAELKAILSQNKLVKTYIGQGYYGTHTPGVIQRNILENPGWYTAYTPYQAEISQGRMEALLNFQTMVTNLTGMDIANASLLDEATAAAEAMHLCHAVAATPQKNTFLVANDCHPQTIAVVQARAEPLGIKVIVGREEIFRHIGEVFGVLFQYPATDGAIHDFQPIIERLHHEKALAVVAADILALTLLKPPGEFGADVVVGSTQRFGVQIGRAHV